MCMKIILSAFFVILTIQLTKAQNKTITGSVQDQNGRLLHFVFVGDIEYKNAVFSDSVGTFTIPVHADSKLQFKLEGYQDTLIVADKIKPGLQIVLKSSANVPVETINLSLHTFRTESGLVAPARQKPNLVGSRYLFDTFSHGFFTDMSDKMVNNQYYLFDYEKVSGFLLLTIDKKNVIAVVKNQIRSFTLYDNTDHRFDFEKVPAIDNAHYVQVLATGGKYKIYKLIRTTFVAADFQSTAAGGAGHEYDEYVCSKQPAAKISVKEEIYKR
jgi:hypothetical protein